MKAKLVKEDFFSSSGLLFNLWVGDFVKLKKRGNPIAEIINVEMLGRGHDNALYTVQIINGVHKGQVRKVRDWDITKFAFKPLLGVG